MESLFFLVPIALIFVAVALRILFWAINSGQYDNLDTEAHRILFDEDDASGSRQQRDDEQGQPPQSTLNEDPPIHSSSKGKNP